MNNIIPEVLEKVDLNLCLSGKGNISNPKILNEYLKFYSELNKQCREKKKSERRHQYGIHSQITRKEWGSAYKPARG